MLPAAAVPMAFCKRQELHAPTSKTGKQRDGPEHDSYHARTWRARMSLMVSGSECGCASTLEMTGMRGSSTCVDASAALRCQRCELLLQGKLVLWA